MQLLQADAVERQAGFGVERLHIAAQPDFITHLILIFYLGEFLGNGATEGECLGE